MSSQSISASESLVKAGYVQLLETSDAESIHDEVFVDSDQETLNRPPSVLDKILDGTESKKSAYSGSEDDFSSPTKIVGILEDEEVATDTSKALDEDAWKQQQVEEYYKNLNTTRFQSWAVFPDQILHPIVEEPIYIPKRPTYTPMKQDSCRPFGSSKINIPRVIKQEVVETNEFDGEESLGQQENSINRLKRRCHSNMTISDGYSGTFASDFFPMPKRFQHKLLSTGSIGSSTPMKCQNTSTSFGSSYFSSSGSSIKDSNEDHLLSVKKEFADNSNI